MDGVGGGGGGLAGDEVEHDGARGAGSHVGDAHEGGFREAVKLVGVALDKHLPFFTVVVSECK